MGGRRQLWSGLRRRTRGLPAAVSVRRLLWAGVCGYCGRDRKRERCLRPEALASVAPEQGQPHVRRSRVGSPITV
ncbi:hypothetical protein AK812_SmicGene45335 [Symbiodinium microadriaticum]|uniref:Uncharacterized protein n=1 Tax=Symbiodinium microadriaticum TaxID=2951 RepID=A0A1Q9BW87_SYMMI|nr:hypothetical protein AK812_SmicGene45335 [Symbiodinium microadriaticum]